MTFKELYQTAKTELNDIYNFENADLRLEQAKFNKEENVWEIVISFLTENKNKPTNEFERYLQARISLPFERVYKKVKINNDKQVIEFDIFDK